MESTPPSDNARHRRRPWATRVFVLELTIFLILIVGCLAIRVLSPGSWPSPGIVGGNIWLAVGSLIALTGSSIALIQARWSATSSSRAPRTWLMIAIVLGTTFLGTRILALGQTLPLVVENHIFEQPTVYYLGALKTEVRDLIAGQKKMPSSKQSPELLNRLMIIQNGLIHWTEQKVGLSGERDDKAQAIRLAAFHVCPASFSEREAATFSKATATLAETTKATLERTTNDLEIAKNQLTRLQQKLLNETSEEIKPQLNREAKNLTRACAQLTVSKSKLAARVEFLNFASELPGGLNSDHDLHLPMLVSNGRRCLYGYCFINTLLAVHTLVWLIGMLWLLRTGLAVARSELIDKIEMCWHLGSLAWLATILVFFV